MANRRRAQEMAIAQSINRARKTRSAVRRRTSARNRFARGLRSADMADGQEARQRKRDKGTAKLANRMDEHGESLALKACDEASTLRYRRKPSLRSNESTVYRQSSPGYSLYTPKDRTITYERAPKKAKRVKQTKQTKQVHIVNERDQLELELIAAKKRASARYSGLAR